MNFAVFTVPISERFSPRLLKELVNNPRKLSLRNTIFHQFVKVFSLERFLLYGISYFTSTVEPLYRGHIDSYREGGVLFSEVEHTLKL